MDTLSEEKQLREYWEHKYNNEKELRMSLTTLNLTQRNVYGRVLTYPNCELSKILVALTGKTTFSDTDIKTLERAGYIIKIEASI